MKILLIKPPLNPNLIITSLLEPLKLEYLKFFSNYHKMIVVDKRIKKGLLNKLLP